MQLGAAFHHPRHRELRARLATHAITAAEAIVLAGHELQGRTRRCYRIQRELQRLGTGIGIAVAAGVGRTDLHHACLDPVAAGGTGHVAGDVVDLAACIAAALGQLAGFLPAAEQGLAVDVGRRGHGELQPFVAGEGLGEPHTQAAVLGDLVAVALRGGHAQRVIAAPPAVAAVGDQRGCRLGKIGHAGRWGEVHAYIIVLPHRIVGAVVVAVRDGHLGHDGLGVIQLQQLLGGSVVGDQHRLTGRIGTRGRQADAQVMAQGVLAIQDHAHARKGRRVHAQAPFQEISLVELQGGAERRALPQLGIAHDGLLDQERRLRDGDVVLLQVGRHGGAAGQLLQGVVTRLCGGHGLLGAIRIVNDLEQRFAEQVGLHQVGRGQ